MSASFWIATLAVAASVGIYFYYDNKRKFWNKLGVPCVLAFPIIGDLINMFAVDKLEQEKYRLKAYGKVYGLSMSGKSRLLVADPEVLRQVCIRDFDAFPNHQLNPWSNKYQKEFLVWLQDDHWRRVRSLMTPTFTGAKIKRMFRFLEACANDLVDLFGEHLEGKKTADKDAVVNLKETFDMFTMDGIATCCYGLKLKRESKITNLKTSGTRDDFVRSALGIFEFSFFRVFILLVFPASLLRAIGFKFANESAWNPMVNRVNELIKRRRREPQKYDDLLQSLIEAKEGDELELNELDHAENHHAGLTHESIIEVQDEMLKSSSRGTTANAAQLSETEVLSEAMFILAAGLETTSTLLTHCVYTLSFHQRIQDKLYDELSKIAEHDPDKDTYNFQYDTLTSCNYLDAVISETLRILPPASHTDRVASRDYYIEKYKVHVPKGFSLLLGLYAVQNDPDNWWKPEKFDPDRFMPENKHKILPGSYVPFSMGPRHCIGMRFSLTEAKIGLAKSIMKYRFQPVPGNKFPPPIAVRPGLVNLRTPTVCVLKR